MSYKKSWRLSSKLLLQHYLPANVATYVWHVVNQACPVGLVDASVFMVPSKVARALMSAGSVRESTPRV